MVSVLKKTIVKLELLTDVDIFLMIEAEIRGRICQSKANNKWNMVELL